jgi:hypothetical protein
MYSAGLPKNQKKFKNLRGRALVPAVVTDIHTVGPDVCPVLADLLPEGMVILPELAGILTVFA